MSVYWSSGYKDWLMFLVGRMVNEVVSGVVVNGVVEVGCGLEEIFSDRLVVFSLWVVFWVLWFVVKVVMMGIYGFCCVIVLGLVCYVLKMVLGCV